jgi:beta-fructofuranosidase
VAAAFDRPAPLEVAPALGQWSVDGRRLTGDGGDGYAACRLGHMPERCRVRVHITPAPSARAAGVFLRANDTLDTYYEVRWEPASNRLFVDRWPRPGDQPFMLDRPLGLGRAEPLELCILVDRTVVENYVNERVALSARAYDHRDGAWGLFVYEGSAVFDGCELAAETSTGAPRRRA